MSAAVDCDVAVVGAGPVGLTTALLLRRDGHRVTVFERHRKPYHMPRAVLLFHQAIRAYQSLGLLDELVAKKAVEEFPPHVSQLAEYVNGENEVVARFPVNLPVSKSGIPLAWALHQPTLESVLEASCLDRGVEVLRGTEVVSVDDSGALVDVSVASVSDPVIGGVEEPSAEKKTYRACFVVGCDGANSTVRKSSGIGLTTHCPELSRWLVVDVMPAFDGAMRHWKHGHVGRQYIDWRRPRTSVPASSLRRRWEFMLLPQETNQVAETDEFIWDRLQEFECTPDSGLIERRVVYSIAGCWAETFARGRVLLAGDAAHVAPQFLGQGVNSGLRDAVGLAWRLDVALRHPESDWPRLMDEYSSEQLGTTKEFVKAAKDVEQFLIITDREAAEKRDATLRQAPVGIPPLDRLGKPGMFLATSATTAPDDAPGTLFIHDKVCAGDDEGYLDKLTGPGWLLLGTAEALHDVLDDETRCAFVTKCHGHIVDLTSGRYRDVSGRYSEWLIRKQAVSVLVRPDFYVYGIASTRDDVPKLVAKVVDRYK